MKSSARAGSTVVVQRFYTSPVIAEFPDEQKDSDATHESGYNYAPVESPLGRWRDRLPPLQRKAFVALQQARQRCTNPKMPQWARYGGRGIGVYEEWAKYDGFWKFLEHIGAPPTLDHELDRIDNDGDYEPGNVRWATRTEQNRNRKGTRYVTCDGVRLPVATWAERTGIASERIRARLRAGWSEEDAVKRPVGQ
jgi:hypothetical protein